MPYPPAVPPVGRTNTTPQKDAHPSDHNMISEALTEILNMLGVNPTHGETSLSAFLDKIAGDLLAPIGSIQMYAGAAAPVGWAFCRGQLVAKADNPTLWGRIGAVYGPSDANNFSLPSFVGRVPIGFYAGGAWANVLGQYSGWADACLVYHNHGVNIWSGYADADHSHTGYTNVTGDHNHNLGDGTFLWWLDPNAWALTSGTIAPGAGSAYMGNAQWDQQGDHYHAVQTYGMSANHRHPVNGGSDAVGEGAANRNLPPFTVINYIIRLG